MSRCLLSAVAILTLAALAVSAVAQEPAAEPDKPVNLKVGDPAPEFEATDDAGEAWKSSDHVGKNILVVYFYPKDQTPGCTAQACSYRDSLAQLTEQDIEVVGVSRDTVESHKAFKAKENLNFTLLADRDGALAKAFGVKVLKFGEAELSSRWTFVIDLEGHIAFKDDEVRPDQDVANVLKVVANLKK